MTLPHSGFGSPHDPELFTTVVGRSFVSKDMKEKAVEQFAEKALCHKKCEAIINSISN